MSRRKRAKRRQVLPDAKYNSLIVMRFINCLMMDGKKSIAEGILYTALNNVGEKSEFDPLNLLEKALDNVRPEIEVRSRRIGGATYQVPTPVRPERSMVLAMRWIISAARKAKGRTMSEKLAAELLSAAGGSGAAAKKREDTHKMAEANKALAHYRW